MLKAQEEKKATGVKATYATFYSLSSFVGYHGNDDDGNGNGTIAYKMQS